MVKQQPTAGFCDSEIVQYINTQTDTRWVGAFTWRRCIVTNSAVFDFLHIQE